MGDLTINELGRALSRIEAAQAETSRQVAELSRTVNVAVHGPADQTSHSPTGILPRLVELERWAKDVQTSRSSMTDRFLAALVAVVVSVVTHFVTTPDWITGGGGHK